MADYSNYPQYRAASAKAQELFNRLYGFKGRKDTTGLSSAMDRVASSKGEDSTEFKKLKATFDTIQKEYEAAKAKAEAMRTEIDAKETEAKANKDAAKKAETASKDLARLEQQRDSLRRQNKTEEAQAFQTEIDAIKNQKLNITGDGGKAENKGLYDDYTLNADGTVTNSNAVESYFVGEPDAKGEIAQTPFTSLAKARDAFLKNYAAPGKIVELQKQLLTSGYIKNNNIKDGTWVLGVDKLIKDYTYQSVSDVKYGGVKEPLSLNTFLTKKKVGTGTGGTAYRVITTRGDAKKLLNDYLNDLVGSPATAEEESAFYTALNKAENKAVRVSSAGMTTGSVLTDSDRLVLAATIARKRLRGTNVDELLSSNIGSTVATDIASIQKYAARYGIQMTPAEALKRVADGIGQENYAVKQQERLRLMAKQLHPRLSAHIDAGGTVEDIADQYAFAKSKKLGIAVPMSTTDTDVMNAVNSGMSVSDFNIEMQKKPEWRFTEEARGIADNFTNTMLKTFGLVG
jgi:hypothetical protein